MHNIERFFNILHEYVKRKVVCRDERPKDEGLEYFLSESDMIDIARMDFEKNEVGIETHRIDRKDSVKVGVKKIKKTHFQNIVRSSNNTEENNKNNKIKMFNQ